MSSIPVSPSNLSAQLGIVRHSIIVLSDDMDGIEIPPNIMTDIVQSFTEIGLSTSDMFIFHPRRATVVISGVQHNVLIATVCRIRIPLDPIVVKAKQYMSDAFRSKVEAHSGPGAELDLVFTGNM